MKAGAPGDRTRKLPTQKQPPGIATHGVNIVRETDAKISNIYKTFTAGDNLYNEYREELAANGSGYVARFTSPR
jgi:hypothetical protein